MSRKPIGTLLAEKNEALSRELWEIRFKTAIGRINAKLEALLKMGAEGVVQKPVFSIRMSVEELGLTWEDFNNSFVFREMIKLGDYAPEFDIYNTSIMFSRLSEWGSSENLQIELFHDDLNRVKFLGISWKKGKYGEQSV